MILRFSALGALLIVMSTIPKSIQTLFNDHQARIAAVSAAPGLVGLSLDLDQISATYLSKEIQIRFDRNTPQIVTRARLRRIKFQDWLRLFRA
jgi:hypothetical protein